MKEAEAIEQQMRAKGGSVPPAGPGGTSIKPQRSDLVPVKPE